MATLPTTPAGYTFGAALTWVQKEYGYLINEVESFPGSPSTPPTSPFVPNNGDRLALAVVNIGISNVYIGLSAGVSGGNGILLVANGGSFTIDVRRDMTLPSRAWWTVSSGTPNPLYVLELIGVRALQPGTVPGT